MVASRKKNTRRFKGGVARNAAKQSRGVRYSYLNIPKGVSMFEVEAKTRVNLDILPYEVTDPNHPDRDDEYGIAVPGSLWYKRPYWVHRNIGTNNDAVLCLASFKQKCPICEHRAQLLKEGADWNDDAVRSLKSSMRNLYVVVPRGSKNFEEQIHVWDISQFLFQDKLNEEVQEDEEYETFPDPEEGFTLQIRFSESQLGTNRFAETSRIDFKSRDPLDDALLDSVPHLDDVLERPSLESVEALFFGGIPAEDADDEDEEEEEKPRAGRQRPRPSQTVKEEDEEEEEEEAPEEEPEEEEEKQQPKASKRRPRSTASKTKCPSGYAFGKDCDKFDECETCDLWDECADAITG